MYFIFLKAKYNDSFFVSGKFIRQPRDNALKILLTRKIIEVGIS